MNSNETLVEQIRRLNQEEAFKHELRRQEALEKIRLLRRAQREQQERQREHQ
jgi:hypothetical protein